MSRILVISEVFHPENFIINDLVREWKREGHRVDILTQNPSYPYGRVFEGYSNRKYWREEWKGSVIHRFRVMEGYRESKMRKVRNYLYFIIAGSRIARRIGADYDKVFVSQTGPLTVALPAIALRRKFGIPVAIWTFDLWPDSIYVYGIGKNFLTGFLIDRFVKYVYRRCDLILVSSERFIGHIRRYAPGREVHYAPNWLMDFPEKKSQIEFDRSKFNFTFAGNISVSQNLANVMRGFHKASIPDSALNIVGDGSSFADVSSLAAELGASNIAFFGRRPADEIDDILSRSDALVLSLVANEAVEKTEPLKLQSYLKAGKPILAITNGAARDIIVKNGIGISADPSDIDDIAEGFRRTVETYGCGGTDAIKESCRKLMNTRFNRDRIIRSINDVFL